MYVHVVWVSKKYKRILLPRYSTPLLSLYYLSQISVVYHVMSELVQELRSQTPPNQRNNIQRDREVLFNGFPGQYLREVGLEAWMRKQGGYNAVPDPVSMHCTCTCICTFYTYMHMYIHVNS